MMLFFGWDPFALRRGSLGSPEKPVPASARTPQALGPSPACWDFPFLGHAGSGPQSPGSTGSGLLFRIPWVCNNTLGKPQGWDHQSADLQSQPQDHTRASFPQGFPKVHLCKWGTHCPLSCRVNGQDSDNGWCVFSPVKQISGHILALLIHCIWWHLVILWTLQWSSTYKLVSDYKSYHWAKSLY